MINEDTTSTGEHQGLAPEVFNELVEAFAFSVEEAFQALDKFVRAMDILGAEPDAFGRDRARDMMSEAYTIAKAVLG